MEPCLQFLRKNCKETVVTPNNNLVCSLQRILDCFFKPYWDTDAKKVTAEEVEELETIIEPLFIYAVIWSIGCTTDIEGRAKFESRLKEIIGKDSEHKFPSGGSVYDFAYNKENKEWNIWTDTVSPFAIVGQPGYNEIIVPTFDSIRMKYIKKLLVSNSKHVLCPGPTGTGKTVNIAELLNQEMSEDFQCIPISFSAQTSANQTQDALDEKFEKRRKGIYGPPTGKKYCIFIDDLNMPKKEFYGAQPPIELLRQWMDHKGWYERITKEKNWMTIQDIIFVSAMGPPGGGRSFITPRLLRHYNIITYTELDSKSVSMIFNTILSKFLGGFEQEVS